MTVALVTVGGATCAVVFCHLTPLNVAGMSRATVWAVSFVARPFGVAAAGGTAAVAFGVHRRAVRRHLSRPDLRGASAAAGSAAVATFLATAGQVVGVWVVPAAAVFSLVAAGCALLLLPRPVTSTSQDAM
jgi:ABC-type Fe3+-siderophore transport system permease subunit